VIKNNTAKLLTDFARFGMLSARLCENKPCGEQCSWLHFRNTRRTAGRLLAAK